MSAQRQPWQNWSGGQQYSVREVVSASDIDGIVAVINRAGAAGATVRCVGSAHSFVPFWTDDVILSLDGLSGLRAVDRDACTATVLAGTKLHQLGPLLWANGLSLPQQGDIDRQSLAGALSTGTHGTGVELPNLSNFVIGASVVAADGTHFEVDARTPELLSAVRVSQGVLGVLADVTLALEPAFSLHERTWSCSAQECAAQREALIAGNRHFEFFWTPRDDLCEMKTLNKTDAAPARISEHEYIAPAYQAFPSDRAIRFNEMEYALPYECGADCFAELRLWLLKDHPKLPWPLEYRTLAADDALLSPAQGRSSVTISVHQGAERSYAALFDGAEAIFRNHQGRPHWGKLHGLRSAELARLYPGFARFCAMRAELDPRGMFLNPYLRGLFEV